MPRPLSVLPSPNHRLPSAVPPAHGDHGNTNESKDDHH